MCSLTSIDQLLMSSTEADLGTKKLLAEKQVFASDLLRWHDVRLYTVLS